MARRTAAPFVVVAALLFAAVGAAHGARHLSGIDYTALLGQQPPGSVLVIDMNGNVRVVPGQAKYVPAVQQTPTVPVQQQQQQQQPQPQPLVPTASAGTTGNPILDLHNSLRARHHAPPLVWSQDLVASAQNWANNLANSCTFYHSGPGENMATGYNNWNDVIMAFYNEINSYNFNAPGYSSATGHATQLLWVSSKQLGCATAQRAGCWEGVVYVCHYYPVGNVNAPEYFRANVLPA